MKEKEIQTQFNLGVLTKSQKRHLSYIISNSESVSLSIKDNKIVVIYTLEEPLIIKCSKVITVPSKSTGDYGL